MMKKKKKIGPVIIPAGSPLREVVQQIAEDVGVNIVLDRDVEETVPEIRMRQREYWKNVLDHIAELTNCEVVEVSPTMFKLIQPPKVTMQFHNADLKVVLDLLAKQSGASIVIAPEVEGKVTLNLNNVRYDVALETIVKTHGYIMVREDANIIRIVTPASLKAQLETRVFQLAYIRPPDDYIAIMVAGGRGENKSDKGFWKRHEEKMDLNKVERFMLYQALKDMVSPEPINGRLRYDPGVNAFLVTDTKPKLDSMAEIIKKIDVPPEQVYVDVKFIRTTQGNVHEQGIRFDKIDTPEEEGIVISQGFPDPSIGATTGGGRTATDIFSRGGTYMWDVGRWESLRKDFSTLGILDFTQTSMMLRLINSTENTRIVQAPKLLTLNNQEAVIFVGENVPYVAQKATVDQSGSLRITIEEDEDSPISVGFTLFITPHVVKDSDEIMLTVIPRTSTLVGRSSEDNPGFSQFKAQIATGVFTWLDLPRTLNQTIVTKMLVRDGNTAVIGGLISEDRRESVSKIPILSSIPIIGNLFTWRRDMITRENLIIFITPRIVRSKAQSAQLTRDMVAKQKEYDYFYKKYGKTDVSVQATRDEERNLGVVLTEEEKFQMEEEEARKEAERLRKEAAAKKKAEKDAEEKRMREEEEEKRRRAEEEGWLDEDEDFEEEGEDTGE
jgi:type IV pilus assembly protein PilQ